MKKLQKKNVLFSAVFSSVFCALQPLLRFRPQGTAGFLLKSAMRYVALRCVASRRVASRYLALRFVAFRFVALGCIALC